MAKEIKGVLGEKLGMTQVFDENNRVVPVTVVQAGPNVVTQVRTAELLLREDCEGIHPAQVAVSRRRNRSHHGGTEDPHPAQGL